MASMEKSTNKERISNKMETSVERRHHRACCAFEILGVTTDPQQSLASAETAGNATGGSNHDRMINSLVAALQPSDAVVFVYDGGGGSPLKWNIVGETSSAASTADATNQLHNVRNALQTILESRKSSYRYKALDKVKATRLTAPRHKWTGIIQPQGTAISNVCAAIGFGAHNAKSSRHMASVNLPHYIQDRARAFSSLVSLLSASTVPLRVSITLASCRLDRRQETILNSAMAVIMDRKADSGIAAHLENSAGIWLKTLAGCRITCSVSSSEPLAEPFMRMLGAEIYHGPVDIVCQPQATQSPSQSVLAVTGPATALDLRDCIPSSLAMPPLFPQPEALVRHGMRRFFNRQRPSLSKDGCLMGAVGDGLAEQSVRLGRKVRSQHLYILGSTGTGKSTMLFNMIMQDIQAGLGVCLVDPHGDLYAQVLKAMPPERADDVVLLDPQDRKRAIGINLLECNGPHREAQVNLVINELLAMINKLYDMRQCGGPMFELYFRNALQLVMSVEQAPGTLMDVGAVFEYKPFREKLLKHGNNPLLQDFWKMAESVIGDHRLCNMAPYIVSKLNSLVNNAMIRPIIGQPRSTLNIRQVMDRCQILLVNLSRGALGELDMRLLGMIVLTKIICAAMGRMDTAPSRRKPFMVYVDEFQNFTTDATASLLSESRKFGLCLTLANQNLSQLTVGQGNENLIHSVLGNVGSMVLFRLGAPDAGRLSMYTTPQFGSQDLQDLPNYHAAARLLTPEGPTSAFVFQTNPAAKRPVDANTQSRIRKNQLAYTTDVKEVEKMLLQRRDFVRNIKSPEDSIVEAVFGASSK